VCLTNEREESVVKQHNLCKRLYSFFLNKLCFLTTLPSLSFETCISEYLVFLVIDCNIDIGYIYLFVFIFNFLHLQTFF